VKKVEDAAAFDTGRAVPDGAAFLHAMKPTILLLTIMAALGWQSQAQTYSMEWWTVDGGGGRSVGGGYSLEGTIGQADAGQALRGGPYELRGGFWPGLAVVGPEPTPALLIQFLGADLILSWTPATAGYVLEMTEDLSSLSWEPAPDGNPVLITAEGGMRFYRLRKE
jgi:hypothetical protein